MTENSTFQPLLLPKAGITTSAISGATIPDPYRFTSHEVKNYDKLSKRHENV
jgi:hypothetical protein